MNGKDLLEGFGKIDEKFIEEVRQDIRKEKHWRNSYTVIAAACFAAVMIGIYLWPKAQGAEEPIAEKVTEEQELVFGEIEEIAQGVEEEKIFIEGHFWEELDETQIEKVFPELFDICKIKTTAHYSKIGENINLVQLVSELSTDDTEYIEFIIGTEETMHHGMYYDKLLATKVNGIDVYTGYYPHMQDGKISCYAVFQMADMFYSVASYDAPNTKSIEQIVMALTKGNSLDLSALNPIPPERLIDETLTLEEGFADEEFGKYVPKKLPEEYIFEGIHRMVNQEYNLMNIYMTNGIRYFYWRISELKDEEKARITSVEQLENYELKQYPQPWFDTVPEERREIVENPIFMIEELSLDVLESRCYEVEGLEEELGVRMHFSVLYEDVLIEVNTEGISAETLYEMLTQVDS